MTFDPFIIEVSEKDIRAERDKARALRKTQWWRTKISRGLCHYCGQKLDWSDHPTEKGGEEE